MNPNLDDYGKGILSEDTSPSLTCSVNELVNNCANGGDISRKADYEIF